MSCWVQQFALLAGMRVFSSLPAHQKESLKQISKCFTAMTFKSGSVGLQMKSSKRFCRLCFFGFSSVQVEQL
jgi:hypothetical protein